MDDDLIVVDDFEPSTSNGISHAPPVASTSAATLPASTRPQRAAARRRSTPALSDFTSERQTRSSHAKPRAAPKLKLKLSEKAAAQAPGTSFLGAYDRELDSDDEELSFEEQFILRMPPGEDCERLRKMVVARETGQDVWFKFKDARRAVFHIGGNAYTSKLVDLPCIIEAQKTLDNKQMFKVADICQMLLVEDRIPNEEALANHKSFNIDDFIWQHGITPPLHYVRKRRFRKRVNKRTIESVEQEVERLLEEDAAADQVRYGRSFPLVFIHVLLSLMSEFSVDVLENVNPDLSDSEFLEREEPLEAATPGGFLSEAGDMTTPAAGEGGEETEEEEEQEAEGEIDEELAAELDLALGDEGEGEEEEEEEEESEEEEEEDEDEDEETAQARELLHEEIADLEAAVRKKESEVASAGNPLIRRRFEEALRKLRADLDMKLAQKDEMKEMARRRKEGMVSEGGDDEGEGEEEGEAEEGDVDIEMAMATEMDRMALPVPQIQIQEVGAAEEGADENDLFGPDEEEVGMDTS
ncbi:hypothetical protein EW146_g3294 [Bondarzewia mesenterica]|uniref:TAFII55 protein conserved region domain-containing protein n=1 Tax=Bondarzewia mesenterica TaxID=1095465 RepID=A0A4S4M087_9AGAM|nr:hypothetical protein EW146_g3294 [Bondarzewia mesenterica]